MDQKKLINFLALWVANTIIVLLFDAIFGNNIVLGNNKVSPSMAAVLAGFILTGVAFFLPGALEKTELKIKNIYALLSVYFAAYALVLWVIKRFALISGLGIANNLYLLILALVVTVVGWQLETRLKTILKKG